LAVLATPACYSYTPIPTDTVPAGEAVRIYVSSAALSGFEDAIATDTPVLRGRVARREGDQLFLRIPVGQRQLGFHSTQIDQEVPIPLREITQVERREFNRAATGAMIAGTAGAAAVVIFLIMEAYGEPTFEEDCPECADMRLPILSVPFR
jgi:hypothetical protein